MTRWERRELESIETELCDELWVKLSKNEVMPMWRAVCDLVWDSIRRRPLDGLRYAFRGRLQERLRVGILR